MIVKLFIIPQKGITIDGKQIKSSTLVEHFKLNVCNDVFTIRALKEMKSSFTISKNYFFSMQQKDFVRNIISILGSEAKSIDPVFELIVEELNKSYAEQTSNTVKTLLEINKNGYILLRFLK